MTDLEFVKRLLSFGDEPTLPFKVGESWFFRTVTYHCIGRIAEVSGHWLTLEDASWIADSGRFMQAIADGKLNEVEPVGRMVLNSQTVVDAFPWRHELPQNQK